MNSEEIEFNKGKLTKKINKFYRKTPIEKMTNKRLFNLIFLNMRMNFKFSSIKKQKKKKNNMDFLKI